MREIDARRPTATRRGLAAALAALLLLAATPAAADRHDPKRAGHPLRIAAYVVHPVGVMLDYLVMRPFHWLGNQEPFTTIFGHSEY